MAKTSETTQLKSFINMKVLIDKYKLRVNLNKTEIKDTITVAPIKPIYVEEHFDKLLIQIQVYQYIHLKLITRKSFLELDDEEKELKMINRIEEDVHFVRFEKDMAKIFTVLSTYRVRATGMIFKDINERNFYVSLKKAASENLLTKEMEEYILEMRNIFLSCYDQAKAVKTALTIHLLPEYYNYRISRWGKISPPRRKK